MEERRAEQQVGVQAWVERARLERERADRHGVLEQAAEVRVVARAGAGRAAEVGAECFVPEEEVEQRAQVGVVDLAGEVLEEAVELVEVAVGHRQELGGVRGRLGAPDRLEVHLELVPEALDPAPDGHEVAALELGREEVRVAERAAGDRTGPVAQLDRQVGRSRSSR